MFNDSYLRVCMKLRIVQKIRFSLHECGWTNTWCPGLVSGPSSKALELVARIRGLVIQPPGTMPWSTQSFWGQITCPLLFSIALYFLPMVPMLWHSAETPNPGTMAWSAHGSVRPDSRRQNLIFFINRNILHTLKKEPLNIMLLHTGRTMDGP